MNFRLLFATLLAALVGPVGFAQTNSTADNVPALLRQPWTRSSLKFERTWRFIGPLSEDEAAANPAALLDATGPVARRWVSQTGWTDSVDVPIAATPGGTAGDTVALGRVTVHRDRDGEASLLIGVDGKLEVFVNGEAVFRRAKPASFAFDQEVVSAIFKKGDNDVVVRLSHGAGPWKISLRTVELGSVFAPKQEIDPFILGLEGNVLSIQTHRESDPTLPSVEIEIVAPGGTIVAHRNGKRGDVLKFPIEAWTDGAYEARCSTDDGWGRRHFVHLPWYKGDPLVAARELVGQAAREPAGASGDTIRMLADLTKDRLHGDLNSLPPEGWRAIHSPLLEYSELLLARKGQTGGARSSGFVRLAYTDEVDGSTQFARAYLPAGYDPAKRWPLVLFLHGYNPGNPEYIGWWSVDERHNPDAENNGAIIIEPHGRGNALYRGIGERDVLRTIIEAKRAFAIDEDRVYLTGESMGGFGTWTVATRNPDVFAAAAPVYGGWDLRQTPATMGGLAGYSPTNDAQKWMLEIQSGFVSAENARNLPLFVHHGDIDRSVSVENSRYIVHQLERWGYDIGYEEHVGFGHEDLVSRGRIEGWLLTHRRNNAPKSVRIRAPDLGAASAYWLRVDAWEHQAQMITVDAEFLREGLLRLDTENVAALTLTPPDALAPTAGELTVVWNGKTKKIDLRHRSSSSIQLGEMPAGLAKHRGQEGTLSDIITTPFMIVVGTSSPDAAMREICRQKAGAFSDNWNDWQKHRPRLKLDRDLTADDRRNYSLILVGGPDANSVARELAAKLPVSIDATGITIDGKSWAATDSFVQAIFPSPLAPERYVMIAAGTSATGLYFWPPQLWQGQTGFPNVLWDWIIADGRRVTLAPGQSEDDRYVAAGVFDRAWHRDERTTVLGNVALRNAGTLRPGPLAAEAAARISLQPLVGNYELFPGFAAHLFERDGKFWFDLPGHRDILLTAEGDNEFGAMSLGGSVRFISDANGQITGLVANLDGRDVFFKRLPAQP